MANRYATLAATLLVAGATGTSLYTASTAQEARSAISAAQHVTTTHGDLAVHVDAGLARLPVGTEGQVLTVTSGAPAWAAAGGSAPREGTLAARGTASDYQGGTYLVTSGTSSLWSLWQSVPIAGTWTWVQRVYQIPADTISATAMRARWEFSERTRSDTSVPNAIEPGVGDLSIGSELRPRLQWTTVDPTTWFGLQALPVTASGDQSTDAARNLTTSGNFYTTTGDWTVAAWVARNAAFTPSYTHFAILKRINDTTWGSGNYAALEIGIDSSYRPYAGVHHGGTPIYTEIVAGDPLTAGRLTLLTLTYVSSTGTLTLYVDAIAAGTTAGLGAIYWGPTPGSWAVGGNLLSTGAPVRQAWPGWIGSVEVAHEAVTAAAVARHVALRSRRMQ